ncbi:MAG: IS1380 family transposase [Acidobacteria bacterium]|nr:IS1380 family transposase [Acidobacteriota bacterium]MCI0659087.1 IS1380 family transposase [Acidobacteriota bacterium]
MSKSYRSSGRCASRIFPQVFDLTGATSLGGLNHLAGFLRGLQIDRKLAERFRSVKARWCRWRLDRVLRVFLDAHFAGIERLYHFEDLETEPLLCAQHRVDRLPDLKTLYRDLRRFEEPGMLASLHAVSQEVVGRTLGRQKRVVLEIDSTVETLYGRQEGAEVGPNPHKPGRVSYHPLLARDRLSDLIVHHVLRPGSAGTATGITRFLHQTLDIAQGERNRREVLARLDSGFECEAALALLERRGVGYVVKMRATWDVASHAAETPARSWRRVDFEGEGQIQVTSFLWCRPSAWKQPRRVVVLRKREMDQLQGHLFDAFGWSYSLFVTNRDWPAEEVARFYDKRADVERTICEIKNDLHIDHVPTASFGANAADLALKILARNLLVLYRDRGLRLKIRERVMTLRRRYLWIAGRIVRRSGRLLLRLAEHSRLQRVPGMDPIRC